MTDLPDLPINIPTEYRCPTCGAPVFFSYLWDYARSGPDGDEVLVATREFACNDNECGDVWYDNDAPADWDPPVNLL
jgi:DNA-directed RNA polymerase subunit RPC12/RpoP